MTLSLALLVIVVLWLLLSLPLAVLVGRCISAGHAPPAARAAVDESRRRPRRTAAA